MATIFGLILVGVPLVLICTNLDKIIDFVKSFINWHF